jgi:predicted nucleotidyltransferase
MLAAPFEPTPNAELNAVLEELVSGMRSILGNNFLGAYLGGSFAHGGWDAYSDVDWDAVIQRDMTSQEREDLKVLHARIFTRDSYWGRHLEGAYFPKDILGDLSRTDEPLWYLDNGSLNFERSTHDNTLVVRWVLREKGITLAGPDPTAWIPPVPVDMLKSEVWDTMKDWCEEILEGTYPLDNRWAQAFTVLMYCRMLHTLAVGEVRSKPEGAVWAKAVLDEGWTGLIDDSLSARPNQYEKCHQPSDPKKVTCTKAFIQYALDEAQSLWDSVD